MRHNSTEALLVRIGVLLSLLLAWGGCKLQSRAEINNMRTMKAATFIEKNLHRLERRIRIGMSKDKLQALMPPVQNNDTDKVWVWVNSSNLQPGERRDWHWLIVGNGAYFVIFKDGRLATPICAGAAFDPWQALEYYANLSRAQAEEFLAK